MCQHGIIDEQEKISVLVSRLKGRALGWYHQSGVIHNILAKLTYALSERFTQSTESVRVALTRVAFDPAKETLRAFN